jgi:thioredoxin 1
VKTRLFRLESRQRQCYLYSLAAITAPLGEPGFLQYLRPTATTVTRHFPPTRPITPETTVFRGETKMTYLSEAGAEPPRDEVDRLAGPVVVEFGAEWCPHCRAVQPALKELLTARPEVQHIKVEDGKGRPLGRSFAVKLWPTLVFLRDGAEVTRVTRPSAAELSAAFEQLG